MSTRGIGSRQFAKEQVARMIRSWLSTYARSRPDLEPSDVVKAYEKSDAFSKAWGLLDHQLSAPYWMLFIAYEWARMEDARRRLDPRTSWKYPPRLY